MALAEHSIEVHNAVQSLRELEALAGSKQGCSRPIVQDDMELPPCKTAKTLKGRIPASLRHIETEQRRRDRINDGFAALRELLPRAEKTDKATFLMSAVDYIKELQEMLQQLVESGALSHLDSDQQWSLRMLLPRRGAPAVKPAPAAPAFAPLGMPALGQAAAAALPAAQLPLNADPVMTLMAALLKPQAPTAQATNANLQLAQLLLAAQLQPLGMQSPLIALPQAPSTGLSAGMIAMPSTLPDPGAGLQQGMTATHVSDPPPGLQAPAQAAGGCSGTPQFEVVHVPKARKIGKVRRHSSASRIEKPALPHQAPSMNAGRPAQTELAL